MGIQGSGLTDKNIRLRFFMIFFGGLIMFGVAFYWRHYTIKQAEYVDFPANNASANKGELRSKNFQLDVQDASPAAQ